MPKIRSSIFSYPLFYASVQRSKSNPHYLSHNIYSQPVRGRSTKRYYDPIRTAFWLDEAARRASGWHTLRRPSIDVFESQGRTIYDADRQGLSTESAHISYQAVCGGLISANLTSTRPHVQLDQKTRVLRRQRRSSQGERLYWEKARAPKRTHQSPSPRRRLKEARKTNLCETEKNVQFISHQDIPNPFEVDANSSKDWDMDESSDSWSWPSTPFALTQSSDSSRSGPHTSCRGMNDENFPEFMPPEVKEEESNAIPPCGSHVPNPDDSSLDESADHLFELFINAEACQQI